MDPADLEQLLATLRDVSDRRAETEPGTGERAELDDLLRSVQDQILRWSSDATEDEASR